MFSLIFFCPADHVPDWQPRTLLGMVDARSVNVKKTTTTTTTTTTTPSPNPGFRGRDEGTSYSSRVSLFLPFQVIRWSSQSDYNNHHIYVTFPSFPADSSLSTCLLPIKFELNVSDLS